MKSKSHDVLVVGAGHAGIEAGLASARIGCRTLVVTLSLDTIGKMSCNPAIGGLAKGHLVKEIDALGGEMGKAIDRTGIQFRRLNTRKGPAVRASRAQADKKLYKNRMRSVLEGEPNLEIKVAMVDELLVENGKCVGVRSADGENLLAETTILTTGTFLKGKIHVGDFSHSAGRADEVAADRLSENFQSLGFEVDRLKTGTPPRIDARTVNFEAMEVQNGSENPRPFSFSTDRITQSQMPCYITYTNKKTAKIVRENLHRSAMYSGRITAMGPRYCPSIEDKIVRFPDRSEHRIFVEPEGRDTVETYLNGISTSLPEEVQLEMVRSIGGLENSEIIRFGYAIEYDFCPATQLFPTLETKEIENLFFAGQLNGTTGYEEAAAQGLIAGINATLKVKGEKKLVLDRSEAYIGVLIDDLVTKEIREPYRMFTSRAEYRLQLREDNADLRLTEIGRQVGLIDDETYDKFLRKQKNLREETNRLSGTILTPTAETLEKLRKVEIEPIRRPTSLAELLRRTEMTYEKISEFAPSSSRIDPVVAEQVEIQFRYEGYIRRQEQQILQFRKLEKMTIPPETDYASIVGLKTEARQKFSEIRPVSIGHASRIPGVSPADISILMVWIKR